MMRLAARLRRFTRRDRGSATVEFVVLFPVFIMVTVSAIEMGILTLRQVMLERGIDITVRSLRIGAMDDPQFETVKTAICANTLVVPNCAEVLHLELTPVSTSTWAVPEGNVACVDRTGEVEPSVDFEPGQRNEFMLMRACAVFNPMFPNMGLGPKLPLDSSGGYRLVASTTFVNEP